MLNTIFSLGSSALMNYQTALNVHSGNVANLGVEGYVRRTVEFESDNLALTQSPGYGLGVSIQSIRRNLNQYLERQYISQASDASYWESVQESLAQLESLFNDSDEVGLGSALDSFFESFVELTAGPSDSALRSQALNSAEQLALMLRTLDSDLESISESVEAAMADQVDQVNGLLQEIADLNQDVVAQPDNSSLLDQRELLTSELAGLIDISTSYDDNGQLRILTKEGQTLVDGNQAYSLRLDGPKCAADLGPGSTFDGQAYFEGESSHELCLEIVSGGDASGGAGAARFKVSLDGGKTFLTDENGDVLTYAAGDSDHKIEIDGVSIWFGTGQDPETAPSTLLSDGDEFTIIPKTGLYWITTTGGAVNISPLEGRDDLNRLSGGSLAGLMAVRDEYIGEYRDKLDGLANSLIWEVNRVHSQGAGLEHHTQALGEYAADNTAVPLDQSGLDFADRLASGNVTLALYDATTGENLSLTSLDFSSVTPGTANFDPSVHSLEDVRDAINATFPGQLTASIESGRLKLETASGVEFSFAQDSSGLLAALGLNTLFTGVGAAGVEVDQDVLNNPSLLNAAHVNGSGEVNSGDNDTAQALADLASAALSIFTVRGQTSATLSGYFSALASEAGQDIETAEFNQTYHQSLADDLADRKESVSGVNLDEELTKIMQYQQYYEAAARLIQTAADMFETVMSLR